MIRSFRAINGKLMRNRMKTSAKRMIMTALGKSGKTRRHRNTDDLPSVTGWAILSVIVTFLLSMALQPTQSYAATTQLALPTHIETRQVADDNKNDDGQYMDIDATNIAQKGANGDGGHAGGTLVTNATNMMQTIVNTILLPIALVILVARLMYIAIGPLMLGMDPFDVLDIDTWREGPQAVMRQMASGKNDDGSTDRTFGRKEYDWGGKGDWRVKLPQEQISHIMKQELIGSGKALLIIIIIWAVINMLLWGGGYLLSAIRM